MKKISVLVICVAILLISPVIWALTLSWDNIAVDTFWVNKQGVVNVRYQITSSTGAEPITKVATLQELTGLNQTQLKNINFDYVYMFYALECLLKGKVVDQVPLPNAQIKTCANAKEAAANETP
jgi:hypothetical protein